MVSTTSERLTPFLAGHEGFVSRAYRCPAGVITIGYGFTMRSKVFAQYWRTKYGRDLRMGDTIGRDEADMVLAKMLAAEYAPPVDRALPDSVTQHAFDGSTSVSFNCGPGALQWKWAKALAAGDVKGAGALLRNTAVTANGRRLAGLVRRRKEEAALIERGEYGYGGAGAAESIGQQDIKQYQGWLKTLGFYKGDVDGKRGELTVGAVKNFQRAQGLEVDGKVGPATRAAMIRALDVKLATKGTVAAGGGGVVTGTATIPAPDVPAPVDPVAASPDPSGVTEVFSVLGLGVTFALIVLIAFVLWRYRGTFTGRRVPT